MIAPLLSIALLASSQKGMDGKVVYRSVLPSLMSLSVVTKTGERRTGCAFLAVKEGLAVTTWHVVKDAVNVSARFADGKEVGVTGLVDKDEKRDLALIRIPPTGRKLLKVAQAEPKVRGKCFLIGSPVEGSFSMGSGLVMKLGLQDGNKVLDHSCRVIEGSDGGPLLDDHAQVIGVVPGKGTGFAAMWAGYLRQLHASVAATPWAEVGAGVAENVAPGSTAPKAVDLEKDKALLRVSLGAATATIFETVARVRVAITQTFANPEGSDLNVVLGLNKLEDTVETRIREAWTDPQLVRLLNEVLANDSNRMEDVTNAYVNCSRTTVDMIVRAGRFRSAVIYNPEEDAVRDASDTYFVATDKLMRALGELEDQVCVIGQQDKQQLRSFLSPPVAAQFWATDVLRAVPDPDLPGRCIVKQNYLKTPLEKVFTPFEPGDQVLGVRLHGFKEFSKVGTWVDLKQFFEKAASKDFDLQVLRHGNARVVGVSVK